MKPRDFKDSLPPLTELQTIATSGTVASIYTLLNREKTTRRLNSILAQPSSYENVPGATHLKENAFFEPKSAKN